VAEELVARMAIRAHSCSQVEVLIATRRLKALAATHHAWDVRLAFKDVVRS
jgi:hypothetical protein